MTTWSQVTASLRFIGSLCRLLLFVSLPALATANQTKPVPVVAVQVATTAIVEEIPLTGTVTSPKSAMLSAAVNGLVAKVQVDVGDRVEADTTLITLDPELAELELRSAEAETREATAVLSETRRQLEDARTLSASQGIAQTEVRALEAEARMNEAVLERLQAEQNRQRAVLERHRLQAPFAGVVSQKLTETGEWVVPGTPVLELTATERLRLDFQVPQDLFARVNADTRIDITLSGRNLSTQETNERSSGNPNSSTPNLSNPQPSDPAEPLPAKITAIVPVSDSTSRTFLLRAELTESDAPITPGMAVRATLLLERPAGIAIPRDALLRHPDGRETVWVVSQQDAQQVATERNVRSGLKFSGKVEILEGVQAGERVIVRGNETIEQGQPVELVEPTGFR